MLVSVVQIFAHFAGTPRWQFTPGTVFVGYFFCRVAGFAALCFAFGILIESSWAFLANAFAAAKCTNVAPKAGAFGIDVRFTTVAFDACFLTFAVLIKTLRAS